MSEKVKKRKRKKWIKWVVIALIAVLVILYFRAAAKNAADAMYKEETVALRDIQTYHTFTGTAEPVDTTEVMPEVAGTKVSEVKIKEGDEVKEGDVLMTLDTYSIQTQIDELKAQMGSSAEQNSISVAQAQKSYDDLKKSVDEGLNSSLQSAQSSVDSAFANLVSAQDSYNNEVELNNMQLSSTISTAMRSVDTAYSTIVSAQTTLANAQEDQADAQKDYDKAAADYDEENSDLNKSAKDTADKSLTTAKRTTETAEKALSDDWDSYNYAVSQFTAAKMQEENSLTTLYDSLITAQTNYLNAIDSYNAATLTVQQQLETYQLQIESAQASGNQDYQKLQLKDLEKQLADCTITAPIGGTVTILPAQEGTVTATTTSLATITSFDQMKIKIKIGEYDIQGVKEGDKVTVSIDALDKEFEGTIGSIDKTATVSGGVSYFGAEVNITADADVRSGMSAEVKLITNDLSNVVSVSSDAIETDSDGKNFVYVRVAKGETPTKKYVTIGATDGSYTQVTEGLAEGDVIQISLSDAYQELMNQSTEVTYDDESTDSTGE